DFGARTRFVVAQQCQVRRLPPGALTPMSRLVYGWLTWLMASIPLALGYGLARVLTEIHFRLFPARRHALLVNLAVAMPGSSRRERLRVARRIMHSYNQMLFEFF